MPEGDWPAAIHWALEVDLPMDWSSDVSRRAT
jgi:hypothetical protein